MDIIESTLRQIEKMDLSQLSLQEMDQFQLSDPTAHQQRINVRLGLVCSFFIRDPQGPEARGALARCGDQYQEMFGDKIKSYIKPDGNGEPKPYPQTGIDFTDYLKKHPASEKCFAPTLFGDADPYCASIYGLDIFASSSKDAVLGDSAGYITVHLPASLLTTEKGREGYLNLVYNWCMWLKPFHAYAGIGTIMSLYDYAKAYGKYMVYPLSQRFLGLELGDTGSVARRLGRKERNMKVKGASWLTAVDDHCLEPIGGREKLLRDLGSEFEYKEYEGGILIQIGSLPDLGVQKLSEIGICYQKLSRCLKPIRMEFPSGYSLLTSLNKKERTNTERSNDWLARWD